MQETVVVAREDVGDKCLLAYFVPKTSGDAVDGESQHKQVGLWQQLFDETYRQPVAAEVEATFNTTGWNSSYTGLPIAQPEMKEWLEGAVERILLAQPKNVLEIGCGSGMILFRVAPLCRQYTGIDISRPALERIEQQQQ